MKVFLVGFWEFSRQKQLLGTLHTLDQAVGSFEENQFASQFELVRFRSGYHNVGKPLKTIGFIRFFKGSVTWEVSDKTSMHPLLNQGHVGSHGC